MNPGDMVGAERKNVDFRVSRLLENGISAMLLDNCMRKGKDLFHSKTQDILRYGCIKLFSGLSFVNSGNIHVFFGLSFKNP